MHHLTLHSWHTLLLYSARIKVQHFCTKEGGKEELAKLILRREGRPSLLQTIIPTMYSHLAFLHNVAVTVGRRTTLPHSVAL